MRTMDAAQATLKDLCPRDKQKVSNLIKQVVELKHERAELQQTVQEAQTMQQQLKEKLEGLMLCNKDVVRENSSMKAKLVNAVTLLRIYQHKVQVLEAHASHVLKLQQAPAPASFDPRFSSSIAAGSAAPALAPQSKPGPKAGPVLSLAAHVEGVQEPIKALHGQECSSTTPSHDAPSAPGPAVQHQVAVLGAAVTAVDDGMSDCSLLSDNMSETTSVLSQSPLSPKLTDQTTASPGSSQVPTLQARHSSSTQHELLALAQVLDGIAKCTAPAPSPLLHASSGQAAGNGNPSAGVAGVQEQPNKSSADACVHQCPAASPRSGAACAPSQQQVGPDYREHARTEDPCNHSSTSRMGPAGLHTEQVAHGGLWEPAARKLCLHPSLPPSLVEQWSQGASATHQRQKSSAQRAEWQHFQRSEDASLSYGAYCVPDAPWPVAAASAASDFTDCLADLIYEVEQLQRPPRSAPENVTSGGRYFGSNLLCEDLKDPQARWSSLECVEENDLLAAIIAQEGSTFG